MSDPAFSSDDELQGKIEAYMSERVGDDKPITMAGLACFCGVSKRTLVEYASGRYDDDSSEGMNFSRPLEMMQTYQEDQLIVHALKGTYKEGTAKFLLQNNHGYKESQISAVPQSVVINLAVEGQEPEEKEVIGYEMPKITVVG